jgi:hypothetical protein
MEVLSYIDDDDGRMGKERELMLDDHSQSSKANLFIK